MAHTAFILVKTKGADIVTACKEMCDVPGVRFSMPTAGPYDIVGRWEGADVGALCDVSVRVRSIDGVTETLTLVGVGTACTC